MDTSSGRPKKIPQEAINAAMEEKIFRPFVESNVDLIFAIATCHIGTPEAVREESARLIGRLDRFCENPEEPVWKMVAGLTACTVAREGTPVYDWGRGMTEQYIMHLFLGLKQMQQTKISPDHYRAARKSVLSACAFILGKVEGRDCYGYLAGRVEDVSAHVDRLSTSPLINPQWHPDPQGPMQQYS